jgi:hypothetical protein
MENLSVLAISNEILKMTRDLLVAYAPLIGLLGGLKFVLDYLHKVIFGGFYVTTYNRPARRLRQFKITFFVIL